MKGVIRGHGDKVVYLIDGREVSRAEFDEAFPDKPIGDGTGLCGWKELHSEGAAVHPKQIKEAAELAKSRGVPTNFDSQGRPVFTSRTHRKQYLQAHGMFDRGAGYGDAQFNGRPTPEVDPRVYDVEN